MKARYAVFAIGLMLCMAGCMPIAPEAKIPWPARALGGQPPARNLDSACVADYRPDVDYFPEKTQFRHSTQLQIEYGLHYKRVRFTPSVAKGEVLEYLFVQCGTPIPKHRPHTPVVLVPIQRLVTGNSAMLGALDELGLVDRLYGAENTRSISVASIRERVALGLVHDMWGHGHATIEQVMAVRPDVYLSFYSAYPAGNLHPRLWELGVRAIAQADHHETHPLGRAEWIKLLAVMANREAVAEQKFEQIEQQYRQWQALVSNVEHRPSVMTGFAAGRDVFETHGSHNHSAQLIHDAGGHYVLADGQTSSLIYLPIEKVYAHAAQANRWLGTLGGQRSVQSLIASNALHGAFQPAITRQVYAWDRGYSGAWVYPFHDQSMTTPHIQLAEAISALHPERLALKDDELRFIRKLP
ncbi:ABC transporter substrate-binding protein [Alcaligenes sp. SDU_A2]|uniref:ABC transporter substrate-binding protein n=1 Tax=Alcaligenes sp. SDU_A2 TaxID=3136634 RepID=UPI0031201135